jgi:hypothetical protein
MTKEQFIEFMEAQKAEIDKYKWIQSEKAGHDVGMDACFEWICKYSASFYKEWKIKKGIKE